LGLTTKEAKALLHERRKEPSVRDGKNEVIEKHASRKVFAKTNKRQIKETVNSRQMGFEF
jgi:deoxyribodipyrimidine photo-lyase